MTILTDTDVEQAALGLAGAGVGMSLRRRDDAWATGDCSELPKG